MDLDEIVMHVLGYLHGRDIFRCSRVCSQWHSIALSDELFTQAIQNEYKFAFLVETLSKPIAASQFYKNYETVNLSGVWDVVGTSTLRKNASIVQYQVRLFHVTEATPMAHFLKLDPKLAERIPLAELETAQIDDFFGYADFQPQLIWQEALVGSIRGRRNKSCNRGVGGGVMVSEHSLEWSNTPGNINSITQMLIVMDGVVPLRRGNHCERGQCGDFELVSHLTSTDSIKNEMRASFGLAPKSAAEEDNITELQMVKLTSNTQNICIESINDAEQLEEYRKASLVMKKEPVMYLEGIWQADHGHGIAIMVKRGDLPPRPPVDTEVVETSTAQ